MEFITFNMIEYGDVNRSIADTKGAIRQKQKILVWLGVCSKSVSILVIFDDGPRSIHQRDASSCS